MAKYIDGYVMPVAKKNLAAYRRMANTGGKIWRKYGALEYMESIGDDLNPKMMGMKYTKFPQMAKAMSDEMVVFSFIVFKSRAHRDQVNAKVMKDPAMNDPKYNPMPFDMARMAYGGFKVIVDA